MPTRSRILDFLRKQQTATVGELNLAMAMTGANIRHHLAILESNGLIEVIGQRKEMRGRPINIYSLSQRVLGDGLDELANAMMHELERAAAGDVLDAMLRSVAMRLGGEKKLEPHFSLTQRLSQLVVRLDELHYLSHWEAGVRGPNIILGHCPYSAIITANPELCRVDAFLLEEWTGLPVEQTAKLKKSNKGSSFCAFRVTGNP